VGVLIDINSSLQVNLTQQSSSSATFVCQLSCHETCQQFHHNYELLANLIMATTYHAV